MLPRIAQILFLTSMTLLVYAFPNPITQLKPLYRDTPLVVGGKAQVVILVPDTVAGRSAGKVIADKVKSVSGVGLEVTTEATKADLRTVNVIAVGNLLDNPVIERLYWNRYSFADKLYPGAGKFALRSVCNSYPYAAGKNAFLVEASDDAGLQAGAEALASRIAGGAEVSLPWTLFNSGFTPPTAQQREATRKNLKPYIGFYDFIQAAQSYLKSPNPVLLDTARQILDGMCEVYEKNPNHHLSWPDETSSEWIMPSWDAIEESDEFTDEQRLRYTNLLLTQLRSHPQHIYEYRDLEKATSITWNHITFPLMGLYFSSRYFRTYYPDVDREQMEVHHQKIEACFMGQEKCWKPREDSAGYTPITPRHVMTWCLAENRRGWIEKGFPSELADYVMATADPMGYTAGHGDQPFAKAPSDELPYLPMVFYLTRDGRLLSRLNQLSGGEWLNPYWRDVKPVPPTDLVGLHVVPMHPEYYRWSDNLGVYGSAPSPHNVSPEKSFDKLTLRSGLTPESQYLLVDGFGRGFHLHYDTNMIIKYTNVGEVLLVDSDYLVRNTTEHNGLSVVRNGRAETLIPNLASLDAKANLPGCLMSQTSVSDYNGVDWHRTIMMVRGGPLAVFDEAVAKQEADYTLWCVWKTLDENREDLTDSQTYHLFRPGSERLPTPGFQPVKAKDARGGEAVAFALQNAVLEFSLKLPRGKYEMRLRGYATHGGNDSLWVKTGEQAQPLGFHFQKDAFGEAKGTWDLTEPSPKVEVSKEGEQRVKISLRESPGLVLDTVQVVDASGKVAFDRRALDIASPEGKRILIPDHHFYVSNDGGATLQVSPRVNANNETVKRLRQIVNVRLKQGESCVYQNALSSNLTQTGLTPLPPQMIRLTDRTFSLKVSGEEFLFGIGAPKQPQSLGALTVAARGFVLGKGKLWLMEATEVTVGGKAVHRSAQPETKEMEWKGPPLSQLLRSAKPVHSAKRASMENPTAGRTRAAWSFKPDVEVYREGPEFLETADLNGDGRNEVFYGAGNTLYVLNTDGQLLWKFATKERVRSCAVADTSGDGIPEVVLGGNDFLVHILDSKGAEMRSWKCDVKLISGEGHGANPEVTALTVADINGDGKVEVLAGTRNCWIIAYTVEGKELWKFSGQFHGVRRILIADVDGDGKPEVLSANRYGGVRIYSGDGKNVGGTNSEIGDVSMALGHTLAGELPMIVNAASTGVLRGRCVGKNPNEFEFSNYGFGVNEVTCADVNGDGLDEILVASETGYIYCLNGKGQEVWRYLVGSVVRDVAIGDLDGDGKVEVVCGAEDGTARVLSGEGKMLGSLIAESPILLTATCAVGNSGLALAATRDGGLTALHLSR